MESNNNKSSFDSYTFTCCLLVAKQLGINVYEQEGSKKWSQDFANLYQVAIHSKSDSNFFYKIKLLSSIQPKKETVIEVKEEEKIVPLIECENNESSELSNLFETTYNNIRKHKE